MILGVYGYQDSGKTTLVENVSSALVKEGFAVTTIKHSTHTVEDDVKGKDSWRHARAGANPVVLMTPHGSVVRIQGETRVEEVVDMLTRSFHPDVVLIEGLKGGPFPKVSLGDITPTKGTVMSDPTLAELVAYIRKEVEVERVFASLPGLDCSKCGLDCLSMARAIAHGEKTVRDCKEMPSRDVFVSVGGKRIATGAFVSEIVDDTIRGMLGSLKGYEPGKDVEIRLRGAPGEAKARRPKRK